MRTLLSSLAAAALLMSAGAAFANGDGTAMSSQAITSSQLAFVSQAVKSRARTTP